ncbi:MAG: hypothetical protein L0387_43320 [Acidobacteria bacterium]|nr:hypothetical protein [Acidobacteriota bacterium]MCI0722341.1 hypothetical protein [Acidobacteriota bacterium]
MYIQEGWKKFTSLSPSMYTYGTLSSIMDGTNPCSPNGSGGTQCLRDVGERLQNLITILNGTGKPLPTWFQVHQYGDSAQMIKALRSVYQIYSDNGFLSNQSSPKQTVIGETYYNSQVAAEGSATMDSTMMVTTVDTSVWQK